MTHLALRAPSMPPLADAARSLHAVFARRLLRVRAHEIELLQRRGPIVPLAWLLLALGAASLALAVWVCAPGWQRGTQIERERAQLAARLEAAAAGRGQASHMAHRTGGKDETLAEAQVLVGELNRPWHALFDQLEAADPSGVHLVQLGIESRFATVQLVVESRELDRLVQFSQRLSGDRPGKGAAAPIRDVTMTHHEWRDALGAHVVSAAMQGSLEADARERARAEP